MRSSVSDPGLVPELAPGLMRLASRLAGSSDAEDLVQSAWLRSLEQAEPVEAPRSWFRRVLVNEQRMQLRGRLRRERREQAHHPTHEDSAGVEDVVHGLEVARIIGTLLDELDEDVRLVVRERYFGGDSAAEIARRHRIPAGTVRWRLKSGLDRLRSQLDARYGGRRALWAGGLAPIVERAPTLSTSVASPSSTAASTMTAVAGKGPSAMSMKILLAATLTAAGAGGAIAWVVAPASEPELAPTALASASAPSTPVVSPSSVAAPEATEPEPDANDAKAQWAARLSRIRAAQAAPGAPAPAKVHAPASAAAGNTWHQEGHGPIELPVDGEHHFCPEGEEDCFDGMTQEVLGLVESCKDFMSHVDPAVSLTAHVIGEPEIGTIVESVELSSGSDAPEALTECLTETMYTLDLGPAEQGFDRDITVMLGGASIAELSAMGLDDPALAAVEEALAEHSDGKVRTLFIGKEE